MLHHLEQLIASLWNRLQERRGAKAEGRGVTLGQQVSDEAVTKRRIGISHTRRTMHIAVLGKTGSGKSFLLRHMAQQDIAAGRGFLYFDLHGDATPFLVQSIAAHEWKLQEHLHEKLVVIAPADREFSVGLNPLEQAEASFVRITEFSQILKRRWVFEHFGARTEELLRNALYVLSARDAAQC